MSIKYEKHEMIELFWSEEKSLTGDLEDGIIEYQSIKNDFKIQFHMFV